MVHSNMKRIFFTILVSLSIFILWISIGSAQTIETAQIVKDNSNFISQNLVLEDETIILAEGQNLTAYQPTGWDNKIVLSTVTGTRTTAATINDNQTIYLDWAAINDGTVNITQTFSSMLYIDDVLLYTYNTPGLNSNSYTTISDAVVGPLSAGTHSVKIVIDATGVVSESNESDNDYTRTYTVIVNTCTDVNLTPFLPSGWDDKLVLSIVTGTHTSATTIYDNQTIYLDWAIFNYGACNISRIFYIRLYIDGALFTTSWFTRSINSNNGTGVFDVAIGPLSAGSHSFRIVADATGVVTESNESDNEYTRIFNVTESDPVPDISIIPTSITIDQTSTLSNQIIDSNNASEGSDQSDKQSIGESSNLFKFDSTHVHVKNDFILKLTSSMDLSVSINSTNNLVQTNDFVLDQKFKELKVIKMRPIYVGRNIPDELKNTYLVRYKSEISLSKIISLLKEVNSVEWVDLNYIYPLSDVPNDPQYSQQWYLPKINASNAWDIGVGSPDVPIGIIDTGVDWDHPDLSSNIWINADEIPDNGVDDDSNGYIDDVRGWDWVDNTTDAGTGEDGDNPDNNPMDFNGHGTHCSGLAASTTNNSIGIASISNGCSIMSLRAGYQATDGNGYVQFAAAASAIQYAIDNGARVISMSFGGGTALLTPVVNAFNNNIVVCHAAGNSNSSAGSPIDGIPQTITVAATDESDLKASFSNYGDWIDVSAPGVSIYSTVFDNGYANKNGTSMSTPIVAGLAGLLISKYPSKTTEQITNSIILTADNIDSKNPSFLGKLGTGRINAYSAINQISNSLFLIKNVGTAELSVSSISGDKSWLSANGYPNTPFTIAKYGSQSVNVNINWELVPKPQETGLITVASNDPDESSLTIQVTAVPSTCSLDVNPESQSVQYSPEGSTTFSVTTDCPWSAVSDQAWCTVTPSGNGNGSITANYGVNTSGTSRTANISVTVSGLSPVLVTVTQLAPVIQNIVLKGGWNIMSFAVEPGNMSMSSIVNPLQIAGTLVKVQDEIGNAIEQLPAPFGWVDNIGLMRVSEGYKVKVTASTSLNITAKPVTLPYAITFESGWNIMGYPTMSTQSALSLFQPLIDAGTLLKVQNQLGNAIEKLPAPIGWVDNIHTLVPGEGYKVKVSAATSVTINNSGKGETLDAEFVDISPSHFIPGYTGNGLDHMNIYLKEVTVGGDEINAGDEIGIFDGDVCVGAVLVQNPRSEYIMVTASLDDPSTKATDGFTEGHEFRLRLWDSQSGLEKKLHKMEVIKGYGKQFERLGTSVLLVDFMIEDNTFLGEAYPNPSTDMTTFTFQIDMNSKVRLAIYNMKGELIKVLVDDNLSAGYHQMIWDNRTSSGIRVSSGIYFYSLQFNNFYKTKKLVIH